MKIINQKTMKFFWENSEENAKRVREREKEKERERECVFIFGRRRVEEEK